MVLASPSGRMIDEKNVDAKLSHVDPELRAAALQVLSQPSMPMTRANLAQIRTLWVPPPLLPAPEVRLLTTPGPRGAPDVRVELIGAKPSGPARPAILHIHGGGFVSGRARNLTAFCQQLASEFDCVVVNVDYRLAPETPYPGPVEDNYAALTWLHRQASSLGVDPGRIVVMGESAGGGHAALLTLLARDRGQVPIRSQILLYPMLDDRTGSTRAPPTHVGTIGWDAPANRLGWESFLGGAAGGSRVPAGASPARVADLSRLPPTFIGVGDIDLFVEENFDFARRLVLAGVATEMVVVPGAFHAFDFVAPEARVSRDFTQAWKAALKTAFTPDAGST